MTEHLTQQVKIVEAITEADGAAGAVDILGSVVDMSDYEAIAFVVVFGAILATAVTGIRMQRDTVESFDDDPQDIAGSAQAVAVADAQETFISDVYRPGERYVRGVVDRLTANATVRSAHYILYGARKKPVPAQGTGINVERLTDAGEGTA